MKPQNIHRLMIFIMISINLISCKKDDNFTSPAVTTYSPLYISSTAATVGCIVESDGGSHITDCGIYISNSQNPETTGTKFQIGSDTGVFLGQVTGFLPNIQYYIKAYAKNEKGQTLGNEVNFTTPATITDYDNNIYETVKIEDQLWMAENLNTTRYLNGDLIGTTTPVTADISGESEPKYQWAYNGEESNTAVYGRLYTWYAVTDGRGICPAGWHLPTDTEWHSLVLLIDGGAQLIDGNESNIAGGAFKESGTTHWNSPNTGATNETLFSALPGGYRFFDGTFNSLQSAGIWCSSTQNNNDDIWNRYLFSTGINIGRAPDYKSNGYSVRCKKD